MGRSKSRNEFSTRVSLHCHLASLIVPHPPALMKFKAEPLLFALILSALGLSGCTNEITDTEGRTFSFDCKSGACILTPTSSADEASGDASRYQVRSEGRILQVCPEKKAPFDCRVLKCDGSRVCSSLGGQDFLCEKEIRQAPERDLTPDDRLSLCLAGTGPWKPTPDQLELLTATRACQPPNCSVPSMCLKP